MRILGLILLSMMLVGAASAAEWQQDEFGQTAIVEMQSAPFPHASREQGFTSRDGSKSWPKDPHYIDSSVAIFIPKSFVPSEQVELLFYFHGHNNNIAKAFEQFGLREMVARSGKNVVFVFPQGPKDASDSSGGKLEDEGGMKRLADEVIALLKSEKKISAEAEIGGISLAGHSGAYKIIYSAVDHGGLEINSVYLLDASYGGLDEMVAWMANHPEVRLRSVFTDHLAGENVYMMAKLEKAGIEYKLLMDTDVTDADLSEVRLLFMHTTTLSHDATVQLLEPWLKASANTAEKTQ